MSPEQQRIKIAEFVGWTRISKTDTGICGVDPSGEPQFHIPNYLHDLNAIHDAEAVLLAKCDEAKDWFDWDAYSIELDHIAGIMETHHLHASLKAQAFLRALNPFDERDQP